MAPRWEDARAHFAHDEGWFCDLVVTDPDAELREVLGLIQ
jgi:hypothetical protein